MTKHVIYEELEESDWICALEDKTVEEAIQWLSDYQRDYVLEVDYNWDSKDGKITVARMETDEEEHARENAAAIAEAKKLADKAVQEKAMAAYEESLLQSKVAMDVAVWAYLEKHKDNPRKGDLGNLYRAKINLEQAGHGPGSIAAKGIEECMERLENGT
jgi:hypothetical protein